MQSLVYRSTRKLDTYLYIASEEILDALPEGLDRLLGKLEFVMNVDLASREKLANADIIEVKKCIADKGYYIQLPRDEHVTI